MISARKGQLRIVGAIHAPALSPVDEMVVKNKPYKWSSVFATTKSEGFTASRGSSILKSGTSPSGQHLRSQTTSLSGLVIPPATQSVARARSAISDVTRAAEALNLRNVLDCLDVRDRRARDVEVSDRHDRLVADQNLLCLALCLRATEFASTEANSKNAPGGRR
ncbi:hypothetical protein EI94DRAFT_187711 [Lactarius quietus]|nr:hypothetical protein EI94DRAFT_187711 [Lactarius quietus]